MKIMNKNLKNLALLFVLIIHLFSLSSQSVSVNEPLDHNQININGNDGNLAPVHPLVDSNHLGTILLLHSDTTQAAAINSFIEGLGFTTDQFTMLGATPTLTDLLNYKLVITWTNSGPTDPEGVGDVLADYIDAGGYVIMAGFAHSPSWEIRGRFFPDYSPLIKTVNRDLTRSYDGLSSHPIFDGVNTFSTSLGTEPVLLAPDATLVAQYTDGVPFVAIKDNVLSISAFMSPSFWSGDFGIILSNAVNYLIRDRVLLLHSGSVGDEALMVNSLTPLDYRIDFRNVSTSTPFLSELSKYDVILTWSNTPSPQNNTEWGNIMADYVDGGGALIISPYTYYQDPWSLGGRFELEQYSPVTYVPNSNLVKTFTGPVSHPALDNVTSYATTLAMAPKFTTGSTGLALYDDGSIFVALKSRVLAINSYLPSNLAGDRINLLNSSIAFMASPALDDKTAPQVTSPWDITIQEGTVGVSISWTLSDQNPYRYVLRRNGVIIDSDAWDQNRTVHTSLDGYPLGTHTLNLRVIDLAGNRVNDFVTVQVINTGPPAIISSGDLTYDFGSTPAVISWTLFDPDPGNYSIEEDGLEIQFGNWTANEVVQLNVEGLEIGIYNYTIIVTDLFGEISSNTIFVEVVDTTAPVIIGPADFSMEFNSSSGIIDWTLNDPFPADYVITRNDTAILSGSWSDAETISVPVGEVIAGVYSFEIYAWDNFGNNGTDEVIVTVISNFIPSISSPSDIDMFKGDPSQRIVWFVQDDDPSNYVVDVFNLHNGQRQTILDGSYVALSTIEIPLASIPVGSWIFNLTLFDMTGNSNFDEVRVVIHTPPTQSSPPPEGGGGGGFTQFTVPPTAVVAGVAAIAFTGILVQLFRRRG